MAKPGQIPQPHGGALLASGKPGNRGGTGRPPKKFSTFLASLREDADVQKAIKNAAKDPESRGFAAVLKQMSEYDDEKPAEKHAIVGPVEVRVRIAREGKRSTAS